MACAAQQLVAVADLLDSTVAGSLCLVAQPLMCGRSAASLIIVVWL
jgi:hypothetical protein